MCSVLRLSLVVLLLPLPLSAQNRSEDEYTRYELLAPDTASFKIIYDVTATSPGAKYYFNPIRRGSVASAVPAIPISTRPYARSGDATFTRAAAAAPSASPPMNVASTTAIASVVLPKTRPNERSQSDS